MKNIIIFLISIISILGCNSDDHHTTQPTGDNFIINSFKTPYVFVVNGADNNISIVDISQFKEVGKFYLKDAIYPHHIYWNHKLGKRNENYEGALLAVAITGKDLSGGHGGHSETSTGNYKVMVLDAYDGSTVKEIKLNHSPHNAIFLNIDESFPSEELWISQYDEKNSYILTFDTKTWNRLDSIPAGAGLSEVTFDYNGNAYATNTIDGTVDIISTKNKLKLRKHKVGENPVGAWNGINYMLVDNEKSRSLTLINKKTLEIDETIELNFTPGYAIEQSISYNDTTNTHKTRIWVTNTSGSIYAIQQFGNNKKWEFSASIPTGAGAHAIANFDNGLFVSNQDDNTITYINLLDFSKKSTKVGKKPNGMVVLFDPTR